MKKFMFAFHGGSMPESQEEGAKMMAKWARWMEDLGVAIADPGSIVGKSSTVSATGVAGNGGPDPLSGYMIVTATELEGALDIAKSCPILGNDGRIEVAPLVEM